MSGCAARVDIAATGTAPATATHLWFTTSELWFTTSADTVPEAALGWVKRRLPAAVTVDLAALTPGTLLGLASNLSLPAGTYRQVHLVTADSSDSLQAAASGAGFAYNTGISTTDANGNATSMPLEWAVPGAGLTLGSNLTIAGSPEAALAAGRDATPSALPTLTLTLTLDAARDVLSYQYGANTGYLLSAISTVVDESQAGGISGQIDASALPSGHAPITVNAETMDASGTHHVVVARRFVGLDGTFVLNPLPAVKDTAVAYDVVISCAGADTVVVRGVPVTAGTVASPTALQAGAVALQPAPTGYADIAVQSQLLPSGARVMFYQTVAAPGELPYAVDGTAIDPLIRRLPGGAFALSDGALEVGSYANGGPIALVAAAPLEGAGGYIVGSEGLYRVDALAASAVNVSGPLTSPTQILAPYPALAAGAKLGSISLSITAPAGQYDTGFVVASSGNRLIETADIAAVLRAGSGTATIPDLPAGSALAPGAGIPYQVAIRAWNSADPANTFVRVAGPGSVSLGDAASAAMAIQIP